MVEVELSGPSLRWQLSYLGSLTERYGMRMILTKPSATVGETARVLVAVPRAHTLREAEEVVALLLERIRLR